MSKKASSPVEAGKDEEIKIPIVWELPDSVVTRFASNILVQTVEDMFKISFFEMKPKVYFGGPLPTEVKMSCVASVVVSPHKLSKFITVLGDQLIKYNVAAEKIKGET